MIKGIDIENFRSIESARVALAPITVLYGPTSSGKSSLFYAALTLRNFLLNPGQQVDGFFNLVFISLGGFDDCVFNHERRSVKITITEEQIENASYGFDLWKNRATLKSSADSITLEGEVAIPYALNQTFPFAHIENEAEYSVNWNGIVSTVAPKEPTAERQKIALEIAKKLNHPAEAIKAIDISPSKRGFFRPFYSPSAISPTPTSEDEVASLIINDPNMAARIATYTEEIFGRDFRLYNSPGTTVVQFQTTDKKSKTPGLLVNDGFGVNQVVYLFAKMLRPEVRTVLIEEPEIHLHPTALRNLAGAICDFANDEKKQVIFTTHSELFVTSMLTVVSEGRLKPSDIKCYESEKVGRCTTFKEQTVNDRGQIEGGLSSFGEADFENMEHLLGGKARSNAGT